MSRDRGGGRWVRPSPSAAYRSSSPSGSVDRRSARYDNLVVYVVL